MKFEQIIKMYAAYKTGFLGNNIFDTYFVFLANIIIDNNITVIDEKEILMLIER